jgi:hypothetical protein
VQLHSDHCLTGSGPGKQRRGERGSGGAKKCIAELDPIDVFQVNIDGDPMLREDLKEIGDPFLGGCRCR